MGRRLLVGLFDVACALCAVLATLLVAMATSSARRCEREMEGAIKTPF